MMNIAITTRLYYPHQGGSIVYARMLAVAFTKLGHEVRLATRTESKEPDNETFGIIRNPTATQLAEIATWCDVLIQVESSWQDALPFLLRRKPWFPTLHRGRKCGSVHGLKHRIRLFLETIAYRVGHTIGVSHFASRSWGLNGSVIPNPYDDKIFHPPAEGENRDIDILFVGRITRDKGVFVLVDAIRSMNPSSSLKLVFVGGGGDLKALKAEVARSLPSINVEFLGQLAGGEVAGWMRRSRVLAFPTTPDWLEASPLTPLEAAACGCTIVASDIGGTVENVPPGHFVVEAGSAVSLRKGLEGALELPADSLREKTSNFLATRTTEVAAKAYISTFAQFPPN